VTLKTKSAAEGFSPPPAAAPTNPSFRDIQLKNQWSGFSRKFFPTLAGLLGISQSDWPTALGPMV